MTHSKDIEVEMFEHYYDSDVDKDGNKKPNKSLGIFKVIDGQTEDDIFGDYSWRFFGEQNGKVYEVVGREVSGMNGNPNAGTQCYVKEVTWINSYCSTAENKARIAELKTLTKDPSYYTFPLSSPFEGEQIEYVEVDEIQDRISELEKESQS